MMARMARKNRFRRRGVTLVEVSIVVVMVGVLAVLAVVGYARYRRLARMAEATNLVTGIRAEQEAYKTERGLYWQASSSKTSYYPSPNPGAFLTAWGGPCGSCIKPDAWTKLNVHPDKPVMYGYATIAGVGEEIVGNHESSTPGTCQAIGPTDPYYVIQAQGDTNGDGVSSTVVALSCSTTLLITNEGE